MEPNLALPDGGVAGVEIACPQEPALSVSAPILPWFCLKALPKHEHIAAAQLRKELMLEVFLPRIRLKRSRGGGPLWMTEALFPGYLFARFDLAESLRWVRSCRGVRAVVRFGDRCPTIPEETICELRRQVGDEIVHVLDPELQPGDQVKISGGAFHGLEAVVTKLLSGRERVGVLLEFLGRQATVEISRQHLMMVDEQRKVLLGRRC